MAGRIVSLPLPLLRAPPFPGSHPRPFAGSRRGDRSDADLDEAIGAIASMRVGGSYWGQRPHLPDRTFALVCVRDEQSRDRIIAAIPAAHPVVCFSVASPAKRPVWSRAVDCVSGVCDPWHLIDQADEIFADADDELLLIAALARKRTNEVIGDGHHAVGEGRAALRDLMRRHPAMNFDYSNPFTGEPIALCEAVTLCAFWGKLIDSNRAIVAAVGFASWKRRTVGPLLWGGADSVAFGSTAAKIRAGDQVAIWRSRISVATLADLQRRKAHLVEVEDGFIRSIGLGAECVPPLSIVVDRLGAYFDPAQPSELENLIDKGRFTPALLDRARALRELIVEQGVSKYAAGNVLLDRRAGSRPHVLVVGQVEDDRSVMTGGGALGTNLELLRRVRSAAPDAHIIYKPHPDVAAGHRVGAIPAQAALMLADEIVSDQPIGALIQLADEVHVNTSLAGFEALLRGRSVVTHGVPFYAGWGLTRDLGAVPERRKVRRTLDELVAAVLLLYPRYLDPESGLPCPPEILIRRLTSAAAPARHGMLVSLRRWQGRLKRRLVAFRKGRSA
jgi:capsular polysaccharide export protein